jgi:drug/metabolite transporter (DMT)-like permease
MPDANSPPSATPRRPGADPAAIRGWLLATMAIWGGNLSVVKWLVNRYDPMTIASLRMAAAALALLAFVRLWPPRGTAPAGRAWVGIATCAVLMVYVNQFLFTGGVARTTAANAALVIALNPLAAALLAAGFLGDRLTPARLAGVALGFGGVALVVLHRPGAVIGPGGLGDLMVLASVLTWVIGGMVVQRLARSVDTGWISLGVHLLGAAALLAHQALLGEPMAGALAGFDLGDAVAVALSGLLATALGALVWNRALQDLGVARTALYAYWVPIFGVAFAVLLLGEPLTLWHTVGLAAVLGGTWLGTWRRP